MVGCEPCPGGPLSCRSTSGRDCNYWSRNPASNFLTFPVGSVGAPSPRWTDRTSTPPEEERSSANRRPLSVRGQQGQSSVKQLRVSEHQYNRRLCARAATLFCLMKCSDHGQVRERERECGSRTVQSIKKGTVCTNQ